MVLTVCGAVMQIKKNHSQLLQCHRSRVGYHGHYWLSLRKGLEVSLHFVAILLAFLHTICRQTQAVGRVGPMMGETVHRSTFHRKDGELLGISRFHKNHHEEKLW